MNLRSALVTGVVALVVSSASGCSPADSGSLGRLPTGGATVGVPNPAESGGSPAPTGTAGPPGATGTPGSAAPSMPVPSDSVVPTEPTRKITVAVWFLRDGALAATRRIRPATAPAQLALTALIAGPSGQEAAAGMGTAVPDGLSFEIGIAEGEAIVDLPPSFYAGTPAVTRLRRAQVVYTLTQFPTVTEVSFRADGDRRGSPTGREAYDDLLPPIVVTTPVIGARVTSPVVVTGTANVFEATVSIRVLDDSGREIAGSFTTATCGTGCRGDYSVRIGYRLAVEQPGTVEVFEVSAADGSRIHVVDIPVTLAASP